MGAASIGRGRREDTLDTGNQPSLRASAIWPAQGPLADALQAMA